MEGLERKLESFIKKYYKNEILKGFLFFIGIGLTYLLVVIAIEYFFWLSSWGRGFLFWSFVGIELLLIYRFILIPTFRLFKLAKGIDFTEASLIIGNYFPEVRDKLINTLQLRSNSQRSDLVEASILQKSHELEPIPFSLAINYKSNAKYIKYAAIPVLIFLAISLSESSNILGSSAKRVINYKETYTPPAPFQFTLLNKERCINSGSDFEIRTQVAGSEIPEEVSITINEVTFFMKNKGGGIFTYNVNQPKENLKVNFSGNGIFSTAYEFKIVPTPVIQSFNMHLHFPHYLQMEDKIINNSSTIKVPEGTKIDWILSAKNTSKVSWKNDTLVSYFDLNSDIFRFSKTIYKTINYEIATSNKQVKNYETLNYSVEVIPDLYPDITIESKKDTLGTSQTYYKGLISDDYGLHDLNLVYYIDNQLNNKKSIAIPTNNSTIDQFYVSFPGNLKLTTGVTYSYYFEVRDNDAIHGYKKTQSEIFTFQSLSREAAVDKQLELQQNSLKGIDKSINKFTKQQEELKEIQNIQKEKNRLDFNDKRKLKSFIERQQAQEEVMKSYSEKLKNSLKELDKLNEKSNPESEQLKSRVEENEKQLEEQEKLLDELSKLQDLMSDEELKEELNKMAKNSNNSKRSMQQLLELTKRFYIKTKGERIARQLINTGDKQIKEGTNTESSNKEKQKKLNEEFSIIQQSLRDLEKENQGLKQPLEVPSDRNLEQQIKDAQNKALKNLDNPSNSSDSNPKETQKEAGQKLKKLGKKLLDSFESGGGGDTQQLQEDVEMLRQILDNLITFSFDQEALMDNFKSINNSNPSFSKFLLKQNVLRENFKHIDDSLFALSLRNGSLKEDINKELTSITFNLDASIERLSDNNVDMGVVSERYVVSSSNTLADMLSNILDNMQDQLSLALGSGSSGKPMPLPQPGGQGSGKQLQDIITSQREIAEQLGNDQNGEDGRENAKESGKDSNSKESGSGKKGANVSKNPKGNSGAGVSEDELARQFEIYKQQESIRKRLEDLIRQAGIIENASQIFKNIDQIESDLLNGNSEQAKRRMNEVIQQFLKLEDASQEKDKNTNRESVSNDKLFSNSAKDIIPDSIQYFNSKELLNRDVLPLNTNYKIKVKEYLQDND